MKKTSIGTWAYNVGPYGENPIPFDTVGETLSKLKFDGLELGGFNGYPNPHNHPEKEQRDALKEKMATLEKIRNNAGLLVSIVIGLALLAFIMGDLFKSGNPMDSKTQTTACMV